MTRKGSQVQVLYGPPEKPQFSDLLARGSVLFVAANCSHGT
jgi:hypothetical protein